jgi:hypothetical protein
VTESSTGSDQSTVKQVATQGAQAAGEAASTVRDTAADQAQRVGAEARTQARAVVTDVRDKLGEQARSQSDRLVGTIRETADHLDEMRGDRSGTPAATVVARVADGGRQLADYIDHHGPDGVLREVQAFARRRPGAFLATALAAGFVVGRLGKSVAKADPNAGKPTSDTYASRYPSTVAADPDTTSPVVDPIVGPDTTAGYPATGTGYTTTGYPATGSDYAATGSEYPPAATEYPATGTEYTSTGTEYTSTGTGTPLVAEPEHPETRP